ncbi:MAG: thiol:disulfide interchange protein precursor [candidate division TA06 bacterium ADurb.Bin131]|jgi:cytochrome c-type biogenesis protein|uniref:Thiol:disulfide interchange protein n=1 Tax=candidate division TA06 bacterium ADurb.Bin131 TaxID=1852827 RepID=A0A1V6C8N6_UNCT6|nr:MAG: thiol:disulfide interchange protein precursor [candidate division TA06 bacterium ADurb.Bin131]HOC02099.1 cytochrome c biogenesis CcdA family protein [bacterium]HQL64432.1 cytochrome c biogenesis CcdA family protein [bacterium]
MVQILERISFSGGVGLILSFFAGIVSFFSPCIIPLIPVYFSFLAGTSLEDINLKKTGLLFSVGLMCLGFTIVFTVLGASATSIGRFLTQHITFFRAIAAVIIIIFALETLELTHLFSFHRTISPDFNRRPVGLSAVLFGAVLGISWTPCVGPILGTILTMASTQETVIKGIAMLLFYSIGLTVPFFVLAIFLSAHRKIQKSMIKHARKIRIIAGVILLAFGFYLII